MIINGENKQKTCLESYCFFIPFRFCSQKNVENTMYKKIEYSCFFVFFFEKIHKIPICKVSLKKLFFQNLSKNDVQNPDIYDFEFLFSKNVISRYYRNYQHFFSNWHYVWRKMNFFLYFFIHFHHGWQVEISLFSIIFTILQSDTPLPHSVAEKTSKSVKILPIGFSTKTRKSVITRRKWFFQNFRKKCTYGDFDENFQKFARCLGVKVWVTLSEILVNRCWLIF